MTGSAAQAVVAEPPPSRSLTAHAYVAACVSRGYAVSLALSGYMKVLGIEHTRTWSQTWKALKPRLEELFHTDFADAEAGFYPRELLQIAPTPEYFNAGWKLLLDMPKTMRRIRAGRFDELDEQQAPAHRYPKYYRRNFHYQTDGYLGHTSAELYDLQVELLFWGTADAMRRRLLRPVVEFARRQDSDRPLRILDVACGTGHLLRMLGAALPESELSGVDLSPHYVARARARLPRDQHVSLLVDNAEELPFVSGHFDVITCIYLMHELPPAVRARVLDEISRVVRPGGLVVLADSIQLKEAPEMRAELESFPRMYHEPFYRSYVNERLADRVTQAGLEVQRTFRSHWTSVVVASKPSRRQDA